MSFVGFNPLGTYGGSPGIMKQEVPEFVVGYSAGSPVPIATPINDGGVMIIPTDDLVKAMRRNWQHGGAGVTILGLDLNITFNIVADAAGANYTPIITTDDFEFGQVTVTTGPGEDFTGGDPHLDTQTYAIGPLIIGTSRQTNIGTGLTSQENVYLTMTLRIEWHGYRWWTQDPITLEDLIVAGCSLELSGVVSPESGFDWASAGNLAEDTTRWLSNWKVWEVEELEEWGLNSLPLGGPDFIVSSGFNTIYGPVDCYVVFGNETPEGPFPLQGYAETSPGLPVSELIINTATIHISNVLDAPPSL